MRERPTTSPMEVVTEMSPGITRMCVENGEWSFGAPNYYLVRGTDGAVVIDSGTGTDEEFALFRSTWLSKGKPKVAAVIVTHEHFDHDGGSFDFSDLVGAPIIGGLGERVEERTMDLGERVVTILPTPGHTEDSLCVLDKTSNSLFTGDTIIEDKSVVVDDMGEYIHSLEELKRLKSATILPGHGNLIPDASQKIADYIARTHRRERMILRFIHHGLNSVDSLTKRMYPHKPHVGQRQVLSHIEKLINDGLITEQEGQLTLI